MRTGYPNLMIILGIILLVLGYTIAPAFVATLGWILLIIGIILTVLGASGRAVGGRNTWY